MRAHSDFGRTSRLELLRDQLEAMTKAFLMLLFLLMVGTVSSDSSSVASLPNFADSTAAAGEYR